jgi:hypothetical protein
MFWLNIIKTIKIYTANQELSFSLVDLCLLFVVQQNYDQVVEVVFFKVYWWDIK